MLFSHLCHNVQSNSVQTVLWAVIIIDDAVIQKYAIDSNSTHNYEVILSELTQVKDNTRKKANFRCESCCSTPDTGAALSQVHRYLPIGRDFNRYYWSALNAYLYIFHNMSYSENCVSV